MRDAFAVLFFVSVGMLFNPAYLMEAPPLLAATLGIILLGKPLVALGIVLLLRYPLRVAIAVAVALAQIGEFSFILATLGKQLGIVSDTATNTLVAAAIVSISLNPILYRAGRHPRVWRFLNGRVPAADRQAGVIEVPSEPGREYEAIVVGYGPVGRTIARLLRENGVEPAVIELNLETVRRLRAEGIRAVYGDATRRETLIEARAQHAVALILSASGMPGREEAIRIARESNPRIRVLARTAYLREIPALRQAGADVVLAGEGEVALTLTELVLRQLGATAEQIDRERDRIRAELSGGPLSVEPG